MVREEKKKQARVFAELLTYIENSVSWFMCIDSLNAGCSTCLVQTVDIVVLVGS